MTVNKLQTLLNDEYRRDIGHTMVEDDGVFLPIHDADGNQTLIKTKTGIWSVTYNGENRPVLWTCGTTNIVMKFDRMGRRVEYIEQDGLITNKHQKFVYDGYLCIQRLNGANNSITELFEWDPTEPVATRPMFMQYRVPGQTYALFYTHDGNKNVSEVVHFSRANGVAAHYEYAPFGETIVKDRQGGILAYDFADINPWRFSSEYADEVSGTVYYNYRHYEPMMGRWMSRDVLYPISGRNPYRFASLDWLGLSEIVYFSQVYSDDVFVALYVLRETAKAGITDVFKWAKVSPYLKEEGWRQNEECCEITGKGMEFYRKLSITFKASDEKAKISMIKWTHGKNVSEEALDLYSRLYSIVLAHEEGHVNIMERYKSKLNHQFSEESSACKEEDVLGFDALENLIELEAEIMYDEIASEWRIENNDYQKREELSGSHKEYERVLREYENRN